MLIKHLQSYAVRELKNKILLLIILVLALSIIYFYNSKTVEEERKLSTSSKDLLNKLAVLKNDISSAQKALKVWESGVNKRFKDRNGIKIKDANKVLEELKAVFKLKNITINLTNPEKRIDGPQSNTIKVVYSYGTLNFANNTDIDTFRFIDTFIKDIPGFIQVKNLEITRPKEDEAKLIQEIESGHLDNGIVKIKMEFVWLDIQDIDNKLSQNNKNSFNNNLTKNPQLDNSASKSTVQNAATLGSIPGSSNSQDNNLASNVPSSGRLEEGLIQNNKDSVNNNAQAVTQQPQSSNLQPDSVAPPTEQTKVEDNS